MSSEVISLDEAKKIALEWVREREPEASVEVNGELSFKGGQPLYAMQGRGRIWSLTQDVTTGVYIGAVVAERCFTLTLMANKILANEDRIVGYIPGDWTENNDEDLRLDKNMKESGIARNAAELERMIKKDKQQQDHYINKRLIRELGIDIKELGIDRDDLYL